MASSTTMPSMTENEGVRRRSLSGASALLARRFTRQTSAPRPTASRSESTTNRRRATIAATSDNMIQQTAAQQDVKVHVRIVPNIDNPSRSLIFDIVDRQLEVGSIIRIGRYSERHANVNCMSFRSKVVSRYHCEVYVETDGKLYIRDTKSSSGTFLNHVRLSAAGNESRPVELHDGDIVQLGVDFQGGREEMYRSVKMKFELNRSSRPRPLSFSLNAFQNLRHLTQQHQQQATNSNSDNTINEEREGGENVSTPSAPPLSNKTDTNNHVQLAQETTTTTTNATNNIIPSTLCNTNTTAISSSSPHACNDNNNSDIDECCICLYALAPFQALFVSPCSHTYHFKCIRPLLQSYPGFQCPICRTYSDLEASVAIEADEVMEKYSNPIATVIAQQEENIHAPPPAVSAAADSGLGLQSTPSSDIILHHHDDDDQEEQQHRNLTLATTRTRTEVESPVENRARTSLNNSENEEQHVQQQTPMNGTQDPYSTTLVSSPVIAYSEIAPGSLPLESHNQQNLNSNVTSPTTTIESHHVIEGSNVTDDSVEDNAVMSNTEEEDNDEEDEEEEELRSTSNVRPRERRTSHIMDKIKMVFFEKRKSSATSTSATATAISGKNQCRNNSHKTPRQRPLSYPNILHNHHHEANTATTSSPTSETQQQPHASSSSATEAVPLSQTLSRQSTTHLTEIDEEYIVDPRTSYLNNVNNGSSSGGGSRIRPMIVDF